MTALNVHMYKRIKIVYIQLPRG